MTWTFGNLRVEVPRAGKALPPVFARDVPEVPWTPSIQSFSY